MITNICKSALPLALLVIISSCSKGDSASSAIVGDWKLSNIQGSIDSSLVGGADSVFTTTWSNGKKTKEYNGVVTAPYPYTLELNIQSGGGLTITETRTQAGVSHNDMYPGQWIYAWNYLNSPPTNNQIDLVNFEATDLFKDFFPTGFVITSVTSSQLVLGYNATVNYTPTPNQPIKKVVTAYTIRFTK